MLGNIGQLAMLGNAIAGSEKSAYTTYFHGLPTVPKLRTIKPGKRQKMRRKLARQFDTRGR